MADFPMPVFYSYPPYFTLQPVKETQRKQRESWKDLILSYCCHHRIFIVSLDAAADEFPLFENKAIQRKLSLEARSLLLEDLAASGRGRWLGPDRRRLLVLWRGVGEWADVIHAWARGNGLEDSVVSLEELLGGEDVRGSELAGMPRELLSAALRTLEERGKARVFRGDANDDTGVKFFA
ncbi:Vacuolar protein sorting-associated protein 25 [Auxenochlorella protothecoides]|uniref:Vacuolar protein sorting-associated protein 25 n=1 Tax=Auxenochlorella protothecoides TaxID=3075 RepID=A0A087SIG8_AUXPR|nr:Vacuolar protein sorting-associated protein 25 [Auxenochlorella protothecoides]KFM25522.1 Vacuolar protein sorting-associated protein 25 [Auxenochlorella protothecoides]RMZ54647.1 hypothetical protein APUTEX25_003025 [Auxenochlorella protothecoides]|eukprot:RMZ54647.1 hypothetical protein APUTEX25_003025 [Auxenochlorella protothecoides]